MSEVMNEYRLLAPFQNKNAGFSRWTYATKGEKEYFIKEFLDPVYPIETSLSSELRKIRIRDCEEYELKKRQLYEAVNDSSYGHIVRILEFFRYDSHYYISTEKIRESGVTMQEIANYSIEDKILLCKTIAYSLKKLHESHVVHSDIKANNILIKQTITNKLIGKIIDFDCSFFEDSPPQYENELGGDQVYLSPEACQFICGDSVRLTCKIDVFALGLLFHQYVTGELPGFNTEEYDYAFEAVLDGNTLKISSEIPIQLQAILKGMLEENPEQRLSMQQVYERFQAMDSNSNPEGDDNEGIYESEKENFDKYFYIAGDL